MRPQESILTEPYKEYDHRQIKRFRLALVGADIQKWADMFAVSIDQVKAWEATPKSKRSRQCTGPAARIMMLAAMMAQERPSATIRLAANGDLG